MVDAPVRLPEVAMPLADTPMTACRGNGKLSATQAAQQLIRILQRG